MYYPFDNERNIRLTAEEVMAMVKKVYSTALVNGFMEPDYTVGNCEKQEYPIASFKNIIRAWKVDHQGGKSFKWKSDIIPQDFNLPHAVLVFPMATGIGAPYPEPSGYFELYINGEYALGFIESKYSQKWERGEFALYYDVKRSLTAAEGTGLMLDKWINGDRMASFGTGILKVPASRLKPGSSVELEIRTFEYFPSRTWVRVDQVHEERHIKNGFMFLDWESGLKALFEKKKHNKIGDKYVFSGDIHAHSFCGVKSPCDGEGKDKYKNCLECTYVKDKGSGCGYGTIRNNYIYASQIANLDFFCLSDHDFQMNENDWEVHKYVAQAFNRDDNFVVLNGYEYTSWFYGHRNIYFRDENPPIYRAVEYGNRYGEYMEKPPSHMFEYLKRAGWDFISIPHHTSAVDHPFCWDRFNMEWDRMVEVFSGWGNSEGNNGPLIGNGSAKFVFNTASEALKKGYKFGFVAGSDCHDGFPGNAQGSGIFNWANKFSEAGSGKTIVLCNRLSRSEVFDSIKNRRAYATTGAEIIADFNINGLPMGSEIKAPGTREITLNVSAPSEIEKIHILKNGRMLVREFCDLQSEKIFFIDKKHELDTDCYYARVFLKDREMAWITPIWVTK